MPAPNCSAPRSTLPGHARRDDRIDLLFHLRQYVLALPRRDKHEAQAGAAQRRPIRATLPFVQDALASIAEGGYIEALRARGLPAHAQGRTAAAVAAGDAQGTGGRPTPSYLPDLPLDQWRRIRGEQEIIARYEPEQAIVTLPALLDDRADRERLLTLLDKLMADGACRTHRPRPSWPCSTASTRS